MNRLQAIPLSVLVVYFTLVVLYLATVASLGLWRVILYGAMIVIGGAMLWFDFVATSPRRNRRRHRHASQRGVGAAGRMPSDLDN